MLAEKAEVQREMILVVDDDLLICSLVRGCLENAGYNVVTAEDGEEGLRVYQKHQADISLLLTDVRMPGMNGIDLADRVLELDSHLPVLFMSGDAQRANLHFRCLAKPFNPADLVGRVAQVLDASDRRQDEEPL